MLFLPLSWLEESRCWTATLRIVVRGYEPDRWRLRRVTLNNKPIMDWKIHHDGIVKGGELTFEMGLPPEKPNLLLKR